MVTSFKQILSTASYKTTGVQPFTSHLKNQPSKTSKNVLGTAEEVRRNSYTMFSGELQHMDTPVLADRQKLIFISCVDTRGSQEDLSRVMINRDRRQEQSKGIYAAAADISNLNDNMKVLLVL